MSTTKVYGDKNYARQKLIEAVGSVAEAPKVTLGPKGRHVIIGQSYGNPKVTKDGVTVVKALNSKDQFESICQRMLKTAAGKTADSAGDGTTTTVVLLDSMVREGGKYVASGMNPMDISRGMNEATDSITKYLGSITKTVDGKKEIEQVGTISANSDDKIGEMLSEAIEKVGKDGVITVEEGSGLDYSLDVVEGMSIDRGYISHHFITNSESQAVEMEKPLILIYDKKIGSLQSILPVLETLAKSGRQLLIISEDVESEVLATLVLNKLRGGLRVAAIKAPGFGNRRKEMLDDIAILTGGQVISEELGMKLENTTEDMLGSCQRVTITKDTTIIVNGVGSADSISSRCSQIRSSISDSTSDYDKEKLQERLGKLSSGVAVLRVGGATEVEIKEKKDRVDDALHATRAAAQEGIVAGGGVALFYAQKCLDSLSLANEDQMAGVKIIRKALEAPVRQICENAGIDGAMVVSKLVESKDSNFGFDAQKMEYTNMVEAGIIDPTKIVRTALQSATSIAALFITMGAVITEEEDSSNSSGGMPGGAGGMGGMDF